MTTIFKKAIDWAENLVDGDEATKAAATTVATQLKSAAATAEAAIEPIANAAANAALGLLPLGLGSELDPFADAAIDSVIAKLFARKSTATAAAKPAPAAATTAGGAAPAGTGATTAALG